jgi:hypothetical protein
MLSDREISDIRAQESDISLVHDSDNSPALRRAVMRLAKDRNPDIRAIAAIQAFTKKTALPGKDIVAWLRSENNEEVRCYLYLVLPQRVSELERVYIDTALAIARRSRSNLLDVMRHIYSPRRKVAQAAASLARVLTAEDDVVTMQFIDILERDVRLAKSRS